MNLELPARTVAGVAAFALVTLALLGYMLARLGAVPLPGGSTRTVTTVLANADGLPQDADVLVHGVAVGSVSGIASRGPGTLVTLSLTRAAPPLHANATVDIGFKTPLGEPFVDLDPGSGPPLSRGARIRSLSSVEIDDALSWLNAGGRANLRVVLRALGAGAASPSTSAAVSGTLAQLQQTTDVVGRLAATLDAQQGDLTSAVTNGRAVLDTLAANATELGGLISDARTALGAVARQRGALRGTLARLPAVLVRATAMLGDVRPLIAHATPVTNELAGAAPNITASLRAMPSVAASARSVLQQAGQIETRVVPVLRSAGRLARPAESALAILGPVLADVVPVAQYLGPRGKTIAAWFANTAALGDHGDAKGDWARFFVMFDPSTLLGLKAGAPPGNSYTAPGDAAHNTPYGLGDYPRLMPYTAALGR